MDSPTQRAEQALLDASRAKELLKHPTLQTAFSRLAEQYLELFRGSSHGDTEKREDAYRMLRALDALQRDLESIVDGGAIVSFNRGLAKSTTKR